MGETPSFFRLMLLIKKGQTNDISVSVSLNKTLPNPYYLFSFTQISSKEQVSFIPQNISTSTNRYDEFRFVVTGSTNTSVSPPLVNFIYDGQYWVSIYEQTSSGNTNPSLAYNKLWEGRAVVEDNSVVSPYYQYISDNENNANFIFISDDEKPAITPTTTPTITPSPTPSTTPPPSPTPSPYKMDIGYGFNEDLNGITADGTQFYAYGYFTAYNGYEAENLIRINQDGSVDNSFNSDFFKSSPNAQLWNVNAQHPDFVYVMGNFTQYGNPIPDNTWGQVIKLNKTDGSLNTNFYTTKPNGNVNDVYVSGNTMWAMGNFTTWNGSAAVRFVQTDLDGTIITTYGTSANSLIRSYVIHDDGDMVIYGDFTNWQGTTVPGLAKINLITGALDSAFMANIGTGGAFSSKPRAIAKGASGKLYVSYPQNTWNGFAKPRVVRLNTDGSVDTAWGLASIGGQPASMLVDEANDWLYYTGDVNEIGGNSRYWGRWIISTSTCDLSFTGIVSRYDTINQQPHVLPSQIYKDAQGRIYLVGRFTLYYNNATADFDDFNRIIRVYDDGTINTVSN